MDEVEEGMHMRCPNCGTENAEVGSKFCQRCGTPLTWEGQQAAQQQLGPPQAAKKMSTTTMIVIAVVAIVVVVIVAGAWIAISSINHVTHGDVDMSVTNVSYPTTTGYTPAAGNRFVQLTVHIVNNGDMPVVTMYSSFTLKMAGGSEYIADYRFSSSMSSSILAHGSGDVTVTFEAPITATPETLEFNGIFGSASCPVS